MSQKLISHYIGIQGLYPPFSIAYKGTGGEFYLESKELKDKASALEFLLKDLARSVPLDLNAEGIGLIFPSGPAPFTGLRVVASFIHGVQTAFPKLLMCTPNLFEVLFHKEGTDAKEFVMFVTHHKNAVFMAKCLQKDGGLVLESTSEEPVQAVDQPLAVPKFVYGVREPIALSAQDYVNFGVRKGHFTKELSILWGDR